MKHQVSRELYAYWDGLRGARAAPESADIDPVAIREIVADTFMAAITGEQTISGRDFIIQSSGTRLNGLWGENLTRRSLPSLWRSEDRPALREILDLMLDDRVAIVAGSRFDDRVVGPIELETVFLPLRHNGKTHARVFGSIVSGQPAFRRGREPVGPLALTSFRTLSQALPPRIDAPSPGPAGRRYGRFKVYDGGR